MKKLDQIRDEVCFEYGYINYSEFKTKVKESNPTTLSYDFDNIIDEIAKRYSREAEYYYECTNCCHN